MSTAGKTPSGKSPAVSPVAVALRPRSAPAAWAAHHGYSIVASLGRMLRRPFSTLLTVGVMAVALALPLGLWLALENVSRLSGNVAESREIALFLKPEIPLARARALAEELRGRPDVAEVAVRSPEDGLAALRAGGFAEAVDAVGENPLPSALIVTPRGDDAALAEALAGLPEADRLQRDAQWRARLDAWLALGGRLVWVLGALLGLGGLLAVGNTVRLDLQDRGEEIEVLQLLGATDGFIRRPFQYLGLWYGLGAGALALALLSAAALALRAPLAQLAAGYGSTFGLHGLAPLPALVVLAGAGVLGWLAAGVVTARFLRHTKVRA
jgi:cell division transport system permease protein